MRLTVRTKLSLYIGLILLVTVVVGGVSYALTRSIDERVQEVTEVNQPVRAAAFEMKLTVIGAGSDVLKYLDTADPALRELVESEEDDFERSYARYIQLVTTGEEKELGDQLGVLYQDHRELGAYMMDRRDIQGELIASIAENLRQLDRTIDGEIRATIDLGEPDGLTKIIVAARMEADIAEVGAWLGNYLRTPEASYLARIFEYRDDFDSELARFGTLALTEHERQQATAVETVWNETGLLIQEVIALEDKLQTDTTEFIDLRSQIAHILDEEIRLLTISGLTEVTAAVHTSVSRIDTVIVVGVIGSLVVAILAGLVVARSITRPVDRLVAATRAISKGDLSQRVEVVSNDEFGILGESFNEMVEALERSTAELETLNRELDLHVAARTAESRASEERAVVALEQLKLTQNSLVQAEKLAAVGQLVAGVAHELNNPLTGVIGFSELLLRADLDPDAKQSARWISEEARRAATIVQNLLSFARKQEVETARVDLNEVLTDTLNLKAYDLRASNIEVKRELATGLPAVMADVNQLRSVFLNLISNAQYSMTAAHDRGTLRVSSELAGERVRFAITDDGSGIEAAFLSKVFDPFFTTKPVGTGTGLGLSICHGIVAEHGGSIWVESEYEHGATFYLEFPVAPAPEHTEGDGQPAPTELASVAPGMQVLVVDDEPVIRDLVTATLSTAGYLVEAQADARIALDLIARSDYDLVLLDVKMPGMSGPEFYEQLARKAPDMTSRVVFMTGDTVSKRTAEFIEWTKRPVMEKPFDVAALESLIARELGRRTDAGTESSANGAGGTGTTS